MKTDLRLHRFLGLVLRLLLPVAVIELFLSRMLVLTPPPQLSPQIYEFYSFFRSLSEEAVALAHIITILFSLGAVVWLFRSHERLERLSSLFLLALTEMGLLIPLLRGDTSMWLAYDVVFLMTITIFALKLVSQNYTGKILASVIIVVFVSTIVFKIAPALLNGLRSSTFDIETATLVYSLGEAFAVLGSFVLIVHFRSLWEKGLRPRAIATIPAGLFVAAYLTNPWLTTAFSILTIGFTLYLPVFIYAIAIWTFSYVTVRLTQRRNVSSIGLSLIFLSGLMLSHPYLYLLAASGVFLLAYSEELGQGI